MEIAVNANGEMFLLPARPPKRKRRAGADRLDAVRDKADAKWRTNDLMKRLRD